MGRVAALTLSGLLVTACLEVAPSSVSSGDAGSLGDDRDASAAFARDAAVPGPDSGVAFEGPDAASAVPDSGGPAFDAGAAVVDSGSADASTGDPDAGTADRTAPSVPKQLVATAGVNSVSLRWAASTDAVGVTGYTVSRDGTPVATVASTSWVGAGLQPSTTYAFTVVAFDAAGNVSAASLPVTATTLASGTPPALAVLAASMQPGQWADFVAGNFNFELVDAGGGHSILEFANRAHWDSIHQKIQFWGMGHLAGQALITYDAATNVWVKDTTVVNTGGWGHGYQHLALDPSTGDLYLRFYGSGTVAKKPYGQPWGSAAAFVNANNQVAGALEWLPQLNSGAGGLAFADTGGVIVSNASVTSWSRQLDAPSGPYHQSAAAANGAVYFGGGNDSNAFYRLNADQTLTDVADAPVAFGTNNVPLFAHPNGVDVLAVGPASNAKAYRYHAATDTWSSLGAVPLDAGTWWVGVTIAEYGVVVFLCETTSVSEPFIRVFKP